MTLVRTSATSGLRALAKTHPDDLAVLAVSLIGPRNQVAKLVRNLELLP